MSADSSIAYFGFRFEISSDEIAGLEDRTDTRLVAALSQNLDDFWSNFGSPGEQYLLFIGTHLAWLGPENNLSIMVTAHEMLNIIATTKAKLAAAGFAGEPSFHFQWDPDD